MSNEPKFSMKQVSARVDLDVYAKMLQLVDTEKRYADISELTRTAIVGLVSGVILDDEHSIWVEEEKARNIERRSAKREARRSWKILSMFRRSK